MSVPQQADGKQPAATDVKGTEGVKSDQTHDDDSRDVDAVELLMRMKKEMRAKTVKPPCKDQKTEWVILFGVAPMAPEAQAAQENDDMMTLSVLAYMAFCTSGPGSSGKKGRLGQGHRPPFLRVFHPRQGAQWSMALWKNKTRPALDKVLQTIPGIAADYQFSDSVNWALRKINNENEPATVGEANHRGVQPVDVTSVLLEAMRKLANSQEVQIWQEQQEAWTPGLVPKCMRYDHIEGVYFELGWPKQQGRALPEPRNAVGKAKTAAMAEQRTATENEQPGAAAAADGQASTVGVPAQSSDRCGLPEAIALSEHGQPSEPVQKVLMPFMPPAPMTAQPAAQAQAPLAAPLAAPLPQALSQAQTPAQEPALQPSLEPSFQPALQSALQPSMQPPMQPSMQPYMQPYMQTALQPGVAPVVGQSWPGQPVSHVLGAPSWPGQPSPPAQPPAQPHARKRQRMEGGGYSVKKTFQCLMPRELARR
jgi:hypothetical protein